MILDTETQTRRAMCRTVQPERKPVDPLAEAVRNLALRGRSQHSIAFALVKTLRMCADMDAAEQAVKQHYPW